ncbi:hypothetical protein HanPSC8_Chr16g0695301 [Helianthus annuus]|nr:hypothetical protein HanPSC8_Chr16g0695301 [Helianthus annuus]
MLQTQPTYAQSTAKYKPQTSKYKDKLNSVLRCSGNGIPISRSEFSLVKYNIKMSNYKAIKICKKISLPINK